MVREDWPQRGWPSVVLKEGQEVIVTIAWQVGGVQVGEELVRVGEFWKELEEKMHRCPDDGWLGMWPMYLPSTCPLPPTI